MATVKHSTSASPFHNLSNEALADELGRADAIAKAAAERVQQLKDELKARGVEEAAGDAFTVTVTEQIAGRLDTKAVKAFLGDGYGRFENAVVSTVVRIKAVNRLALAA